MIAGSHAYAANDDLNQYLARVIQAWDLQDNFKDAALISYHFDPSLIKDAVPLTIVVYKDSGWITDTVVRKVEHAYSIFGGQCQIYLNPIMILQAKNKNGTVVNEPDPRPFMADSELELSSNLLKPVFYFVASENQNRANLAGAAYVFDKPRLTKEEEQAADAGFIYHSNAMGRAHNGEIAPGKINEFEILVHELGHILLKQTIHLSAPGNFLSEDGRTNVIQPAQCETMKKNITAMKKDVEQRRAAYRKSNAAK